MMQKAFVGIEASPPSVLAGINHFGDGMEATTRLFTADCTIMEAHLRLADGDCRQSASNPLKQKMQIPGASRKVAITRPFRFVKASKVSRCHLYTMLRIVEELKGARHR